MLSPRQAPNASTPRQVTKKTCCDKLVTSRVTPKSKTPAKKYLNQAFIG